MQGNVSGYLPGGNQIITGTGNGGLVRALPKTAFSFPAAPTGGGSANIVLVRYLDTLLWVSGP